MLPEWLCRVPPAPGSLGRLLAGLEVVKDLVHVLYGQVLVVVVVDLRGGKNSGFSFCNVLFNNMIFLVENPVVFSFKSAVIAVGIANVS